VRVVPRCKAIDNIALTQYDQTIDWARRVIAINSTARGDLIAAYVNSRPPCLGLLMRSLTFSVC